MSAGSRNWGSYPTTENKTGQCDYDGKLTEFKRAPHSSQCHPRPGTGQACKGTAENTPALAFWEGKTVVLERAACVFTDFISVFQMFSKCDLQP